MNEAKKHFFEPIFVGFLKPINREKIFVFFKKIKFCDFLKISTEQEKSFFLEPHILTEQQQQQQQQQ